jgi:NAD(P)H-dependent flavin oxidoreductase YrpB (nitropropane dioxygenase family)
LRDAGIILLATATNPQEAQAVADAGIHAVVAQGYEAGGHRGGSIRICPIAISGRSLLPGFWWGSSTSR